MKKVIFGLMMLSTSAMAGNYGGIQYGMANFELQGLTADPTMIVGTLGYEVNESLAFEGRFGLGLQDDEINVLGYNTGYDLSVRHIISAFAKASIPLSGAKAYLLAGYTDVELTVKSGGYSASLGNNGFSYGAGVEIGDGNTKGVFEYVNLIDKDGGVLESFNVGVKVNF